MSEKELREKRLFLYEKYCEELKKYFETKTEYPQDQAYIVADMYIQRPFFKWYDISYNDEIVGFIILTQKIAGEGICICEAYIIPEYRRKGLMSDAFEKIFAGYRETVSLEIFRKNSIAKKFWNNVFKGNGYVLKNISDTDEIGLNKYIFRKS